MKEKLNIIHANINNLTSLWQKAAGSLNGCFLSDNFNYCYVVNSDWPNRLWFEIDITKNSISSAKNLILSTSKNIIIPYWDIYDGTSCKILENAGFRKKSVQSAMVLKLNEQAQAKFLLNFERVMNANQAKLWEEIYLTVFKYRISEEILKKSYDSIEFYLASYKKEFIGTVIIYQTSDIVGIHGLGIIPTMRRKGFAEEIMNFTLNRAASLNATHVTLQASEMGKDLYVKLGFKEIFLIKNYILNQNN